MESGPPGVAGPAVTTGSEVVLVLLPVLGVAIE